MRSLPRRPALRRTAADSRLINNCVICVSPGPERVNVFLVTKASFAQGTVAAKSPACGTVLRYLIHKYFEKMPGPDRKVCVTRTVLVRPARKGAGARPGRRAVSAGKGALAPARKSVRAPRGPASNAYRPGR